MSAPSNLEAIRARHAARLARIAAKQAASTAMDDDMAVLLAALDRSPSAEIAMVLRGQANEVDHNWSDDTAIAISAHIRDVADLFDRAAPVAPDAEPDSRPLSEDVTTHTLGVFTTHNDGRVCGYHSRLGAWAFDGASECLRDHPTMAQILASAPGDEEPTC